MYRVNETASKAVTSLHRESATALSDNCRGFGEEVPMPYCAGLLAQI